MSRFLKRMEKNIQKLEKKIHKEEQSINQLAVKLESNKITKADFNIKKRQIEERINALNTRIRWYRGGISKEKRVEEEKAEEKRLKQEEKEKKKAKQSRKTDNE